MHLTFQPLQFNPITFSSWNVSSSALLWLYTPLGFYPSFWSLLSSLGAFSLPLDNFHTPILGRLSFACSILMGLSIPWLSVASVYWWLPDLYFQPSLFLIRLSDLFSPLLICPGDVPKSACMLEFITPLTEQATTSSNPLPALCSLGMWLSHACPNQKPEHHPLLVLPLSTIPSLPSPCLIDPKTISEVLHFSLTLYLLPWSTRLSLMGVSLVD